MLIRISLIVAILAALAAGTVNVVLVKDKISTLVTDRDTQRDGKVKAEASGKRQKKIWPRRKRSGASQSGFNGCEGRGRQSGCHCRGADKRADDLSDKLTKTTSDRDDTQAELAAYEGHRVTADQVGKLNHALKDAQEAIDVANEEKMVLMRTVTRLTKRTRQVTGTEYVVKLRADLRGKILVVDPKWDFVVLNIGQDQGVLEDGELLVSRDGKLVAKVIVRSIEKDRCIANVVPGWKLGEVIEGDEVSPAHPHPEIKCRAVKWLWLLLLGSVLVGVSGC